MATTTNTGAKKIDQNEQWRNILGIHNDTVDAYDEHINSHSQAIGNLSNLTTTEKGSLVGAANELNGKITNYSDLPYVQDANNAPYGWSRADGTNGTNLPLQNSRFTIFTSDAGTLYYKPQIAISDNGQGIFYRNYDMGLSTWTAWESLALKNDISGKVSGPSSATDARVAVFDGTTGKAIKDSGYTIAKSVPTDAEFTDTTYSAATTSAAGLMSADDKTKLNGIATGATANVVSNSLTDTSTTNALSAAQGKALNDKFVVLSLAVDFDSNGMGTIQNFPSGMRLLSATLDQNWMISVAGNYVVAISTGDGTSRIRNDTENIDCFFMKG